MVILPYRDRLDYLARYLQQLVMESLGKEKDLMGKIVEQGLTVFGNKGSTDQHAYVQQLREGRSDFFVTFIEVQEEGFEDSIEVEPGIHSGLLLGNFRKRKVCGRWRISWAAKRRRTDISDTPLF